MSGSGNPAAPPHGNRWAGPVNIDLAQPTLLHLQRAGLSRGADVGALRSEWPVSDLDAAPEPPFPPKLTQNGCLADLLQIASERKKPGHDPSSTLTASYPWPSFFAV
jgi:hypothetical protein